MSDQDFFFDEDEQPTPARVAKAAPEADETQAVVSVAGAQGISMAVASLIGVIALLAGVIVGVLLPIGNAPSATTGTVATTPSVPGGTGGTGGTGGGSTAPQLTPEQLKGGELPAGHPDIGKLSGGSGSKETTTK